MTDKNDLIKLEIDGVEVEARPGSMIIEAAAKAGIHIPRFCYHKKLSVAASCRMCMVEVEKAPKPLPACATPVNAGMKVFTQSELARDAQKGTMEFLLINHPLDCPICDQGGECELQDVALGYGGDVSRFTEAKRTVPDPDLGPLVATDMNRCIHCTRCVRFGAEIAGMRELGATGRGEFMRIGTFIEKSVDSEVSGNIVDVCPVGALTAKPSRFKFRPWELVARPSVAAHDAVGSNIQVHLNKGRVVRVVPEENEAINECWISDRDRFSYEGLYSDDRATAPMIRKNGEWTTVSWDVALEVVARSLKGVDPQETGALASPGSTLEELFLLQKLMRGLGVDNLDHRLRITDFRGQDGAPAFPSLGVSIESLEQRKSILLVGSNVRKDQPMIGLRLRKAAAKGAALMSINPRDYDFYFDQKASLIAPYVDLPETLAGVARAVLEETKGKAPDAIAGLIGDAPVDDAAREMAARLLEGDGLILLGPLALNHPDAALLQALATVIGEAAGAVVGQLPEGANSAGAWLAGMTPHRLPGGDSAGEAGKSVQEMLAAPLKNWLLLNVEPEFDSANPLRMKQALTGADLVVALTPYASESIKAVASVILPIAAPLETPGSFINLEGRKQSFKAAANPPGEAKHGWAVLRMLGHMLELPGFDQMRCEQVTDEAMGAIGEIELASNTFAVEGALEMVASGDEFYRFSEPGIYGCDALARRAKSLQATADARDRLLISVDDAKASELRDGDTIRVSQDGVGADMTVRVDATLPPGGVCVQLGYPGASQLGAAFGPMELTKVL